MQFNGPITHTKVAPDLRNLARDTRADRAITVADGIAEIAAVPLTDTQQHIVNHLLSKQAFIKRLIARHLTSLRFATTRWMTKQ